jgi:hypothetical protein
MAAGLAVSAVVMASCEFPTAADYASDIRAALAADLPAGTVIRVADPGVGEGDADHAYVHAAVTLTASADMVPVKAPFAGLTLRAWSGTTAGGPIHAMGQYWLANKSNSGKSRIWFDAREDMPCDSCSMSISGYC